MSRVETHAFNRDDDSGMPSNAGELIIASVIDADAIGSIETDGDGMVVVWQANAAEQIEAALFKLGWKLVKIKKTNE